MVIMEDMSNLSELSSTASSSPSTTITQQSPPPFSNDVLSELDTMRVIARELAQKKHAEMKSRKKTPEVHVMKKTNKLLTKRQISSKKSAEICRIKSQIYTELLEQAVLKAEMKQRAMLKKLSAQIEQTTSLKSQITKLEGSDLVQTPDYQDPESSEPMTILSSDCLNQYQDESTIRELDEQPAESAHCGENKTIQADTIIDNADVFLPDMGLDCFSTLLPLSTKPAEENDYITSNLFWNEPMNISLSPVTVMDSNLFSSSTSQDALIDTLR